MLLHQASEVERSDMHVWYADNTEKEQKALAFATDSQSRLTASENGRPLMLCPKNEAGTPKLVKLPPKQSNAPPQMSCSRDLVHHCTAKIASY